LLCVHAFRELSTRYGCDEVTIIAPYRRQVRLVRQMLSVARRRNLLDGLSGVSDSEWRSFLRTRVSTVDSFQGAESDAIIICYVRSNSGHGIGFVDDPNRVNVAHTRSRREMVIVGDLDCLVEQSRNNMFRRMARAFERDGAVIDVSEAMVAALLKQYGEDLLTAGGSVFAV